MSGPRHIVLASTLLFFAAPGVRAGGEYTVDRTDDVLAADACFDGVPDDCSLRGAVRRSNQDSVDSVIILPDGLYDLTIEGLNEDDSTTGDLDVRSDALVMRAAPGAHPIIHQRADDRIFDLDPTADAVTFEGPLTLRGGIVASSNGFFAGGSIHALRLPRLTLVDVAMEEGISLDAGGCLYWAASPTQTSSLDLDRVTFSGCETGGIGGGLFVGVEDATVTLDRIVARNNVAAERGGGVYLAGGTRTVAMRDTALVHNRAGSNVTTFGEGGGLFVAGGSLSILRSSVSRNQAGVATSAMANGGGVAASGSALLVRNTTLSQNRVLGTSRLGGELVTQGGSADLDFVTVRGDDGNNPTAIAYGLGSTVNLFASVIEGACTSVGGTLVSSGLNVEHSLVDAPASQCRLTHPGDQFVLEPLLRPLAGYGGPTQSHALVEKVTSTFIVGSASCPATDQRGAPRLGLFCHAGSVEDGVAPPGTWIFADGFDSGNVGAWSDVIRSGSATAGSSD